MTNCLFCMIIEGKVPSSTIYKDNLCTAFLDIQPINPGHVLIVPNLHAANISELDENTGAHIFKIGMKINKVLRNSGIKCDGINMFVADGEAAMQEIFHFHLHIFPRFKDDGFGLKFGASYSQKPTKTELDDMAKKICSNFQPGK